MRGVERRIEAGPQSGRASVASIFVSRWDGAVSRKVPAELTNRLGIAIARRTYRAYRELLASPRFQLAPTPARARSGYSGPAPAPRTRKLRHTICESARLALTVNTMPEATLKAFADHGEISEILKPDGGDSEKVLAGFAKAGIDVDGLAAQLQKEGAASFVKSWNDLMACIESKSAAMRKAS